MTESTPTVNGDSSSSLEGYAIQVANDSHEWYRSHAIRTRRMYKSLELSLLILSSAIPLSVALAPGGTIVPAVIGSIVAVLAGTRSIFNWQENYLRYSEAREAVERERRRYMSYVEPYSDENSRHQLLVDAISKIEQDEMRTWVSIIATGRQRVVQSLGDQPASSDGRPPDGHRAP